MDIKDGKDSLDSINKDIRASKGYINDFIIDVREILEDIEMELVNLQMDPESKDSINSIYCSINTIKGLTGLLSNPLCNKIAKNTAELLDVVRTYNPAVTKNVVNIIFDSVNYIRKLCTDTPLIIHNQFLSEIEGHIKNISRIKEDILNEVHMADHNENGIMGQSNLREKKTDVTDIIKSIKMQKIKNGNSDQYVKIPLERLDQIIEIIQDVERTFDSVKNEAVLRFGTNDAFTVKSSNSYFLINDVKDILKELRMVTLQQAFQKLTRSTCSIIEENHLEVKFSTLGENVEVDKELADGIASPISELIKLLLEKINPAECTGKIKNIEVIAYQDNEDICIDITGDMPFNIEELKREQNYINALQKLSSFNCRVLLYDNNENGVKISITTQK